jgi:hypothetical protein
MITDTERLDFIQRSDVNLYSETTTESIYDPTIAWPDKYNGSLRHITQRWWFIDFNYTKLLDKDLRSVIDRAIEFEKEMKQ